MARETWRICMIRSSYCFTARSRVLTVRFALCVSSRSAHMAYKYNSKLILRVLIQSIHTIVFPMYTRRISTQLAGTWPTYTDPDVHATTLILEACTLLRLETSPNTTRCELVYCTTEHHNHTISTHHRSNLINPDAASLSKTLQGEHCGYGLTSASSSKSSTDSTCLTRLVVLSTTWCNNSQRATILKDAL